MLDHDDVLLFPVLDNLFTKSDVIEGLIRIEDYHEGNIFDGTEFSELGYVYSEGNNSIHLDDAKGSIALVKGDQSQIFASEGENFLILNSDNNSLNVSDGIVNVIWDTEANIELKIYQNDSEINILLPEMSLNEETKLTFDDQNSLFIDGASTNIKIMSAELANSRLNFKDYKGFSLSFDESNYQEIINDDKSTSEILTASADNKNIYQEIDKDDETIQIREEFSENDKLFFEEIPNLDQSGDYENIVDSFLPSNNFNFENEILQDEKLSINSKLVENEELINPQDISSIIENEFSLANNFDEKIITSDFKLDEGNDDLIYGDLDDFYSELSLRSIEEKQEDVENNLDNFISLDISDYYWDDELALIQDLIL